MSRIYQAYREHKNLSRWIKEAIENVSSKNLEILMDREVIELLSRRNVEISMDRKAVKMLSRRQREQENSSMDPKFVEEL